MARKYRVRSRGRHVQIRLDRSVVSDRLVDDAGSECETPAPPSPPSKLSFVRLRLQLRLVRFEHHPDPIRLAQGIELVGVLVGESLRRAFEKAKGAGEPERSAVPSPFAAKSRLPLIRPVYPRTMPTHGPPSKETVRVQKQARQERRAAIATTLDELRGGTGSLPPKKGKR